MSRIVRRWAAAAGALLLGQALSFANALQGGDLGAPCPNQKATHVRVEIEERGRTRTCGVGIKILGIGGSIIGVKCPRFEVRTPAHQTCKGEPVEGMKCVPDGVLIVEVRECNCGGLMLPYIHTGLPTHCTCGDWRAAGQVETFRTASC